MYLFVLSFSSVYSLINFGIQVTKSTPNLHELSSSNPKPQKKITFIMFLRESAGNNE